MKRKLSLLRVVVFGLALLTGTASAQLPQIISYQGIDLLNPNSTIDVTVSIFDAATGGANLWSEDHMGTSTSTIGTFSILIGSKSTIPLGTLNWNKAYWLEIQISGVAMTPRTELAASPYAFEALEALGVADGSIVPDDINDGGTDPRDGEVLAYNAQSGNFQWVAAGGSDSGSGALDQIVAGPGIQVTNGTGPVVTVGVASQGITSGMIANDAINTRHIAPGAVASAQIAANAVITQHIGPQQVTLPKINSRGASFGQAIMYNGVTLIYGFPTPGGPAGGELSGTYPNPIIADNVIDGDNVIDESLTGADILNESIGVDDIGPDAVGTSEIINESILSEDIDTGAVTTSEILNETILSEDIATGAVTTDEILNETILSEDIMDGTILSDDIAAAGLAHTALITTIDITIPNAERDAVWQKIYSEVIENETIRAEDIDTGAVTTSEILDGTILSDDIATGPLNTALITVGNPVANTADAVWREIYSEVIEDETIRAEDIATGAVRTEEILDETIRAVDIDTSAVTTGEILDETILKEDIATGAVTTDEILDGDVQTVDIADLGVTTAKIDNLGVTTAKIADDAVTYTKVSSVGGAAGQVLKINSANDVVWQNDDVTLPWVEIDTTSGTWTIELQKQGTSRGVFRGFVSDSANDSPAIEGVTQGTGPGINAISLYGTGVVATGVNGANFTATGSGDALNAQNTGGAGRAGFFNNTDANNANDVVVAQSSGPITPGNAVVKVDATNLNGGAGVAVKVNGRSGDAVDAQNIGDTGRAGLFSNTSTANENDVVVAQSNGPIMPGNAVVKVNATNLDGGAGVAVQIDGWGDAVNAQNESDIGRAGFFSNTDIANVNDVVVARSIGPIMLGHAVVQAHATNLSGGAGVRSNVTGVSGWAGVFDSDSGTDGVRIESNSTNNDAVALWLEQGAMKLTYRVGAGNTTVMNHDDIIVVVPDDNTLGTTNSVMLPSAGVDGQVIYVINGDGDAALSSRAQIGTIIGQIVGVTSIGQNRVRGFIWSTGEGGWMPLGQ
ncbi:MAG: hypothetical protein J4G05_06080 [Chlorobi bacterium]|nr:hypothetical protein [Chlorobiota bacterium]